MLHHRRTARFLNALGIFYVVVRKPNTTIDSSTQWAPQLDPTLFKIADDNRDGRFLKPAQAAQSAIANTTWNIASAGSGSAQVDPALAVANYNIHEFGLHFNVTGKDVVKSVQFLNDNFNILNEDKFGPLKNVENIIVVQVHNRLAYLTILIDTLRGATGIEKALIVFSHDIAVPAINSLVRSIEFARVLQIFYPYNTQLFPHVFPGQDPADCPEKIKKETAQQNGCKNWESPDKYGNYRVAKLTQIKHHWWWKMNYVFDRVISAHNLEDKYVILLEEDHYVTPDFLHVLNHMAINKQLFCQECTLLCLGIYVKNFKSATLVPDHLAIAPWYSSKYNMGMAFQKKLWDSMKNCSEVFCAWDDYNWDWSMLQVSVQCLPTRWKVLYTKAPRVLHIGDCGVHAHHCDSKAGAERAADYVIQHAEQFYPKSMKVNEVSRRMMKPSKANGGWGDPRDHMLCRRNTFPLKNDSPFESVLFELYNSTVKAP